MNPTNWCKGIVHNLCSIETIFEQIHLKYPVLRANSSINRRNSHREYHQNKHKSFRRIHPWKLSILECQTHHLKMKINCLINFLIVNCLIMKLPYSPVAASPSKNEHVNDNVVPLRTTSTSKFGLLRILSPAASVTWAPSSVSSASTVWLTLNLTITLSSRQKFINLINWN